MCEGVKLGVHFPGFPSLKHILHTGTLEKRGVHAGVQGSKPGREPIPHYTTQRSLKGTLGSLSRISLR